MMWSLITSFFTPTYLFLFLNLVIGIILLTSRKKPLPHHHHQPQQLARSPSLLERVKSINFSLYKFDSDQTPAAAPGYEENQYPDNPNPNPLARTPSLLDRLKSIKFSSLYGSEEHHPTEINIDHPETPESETVAKPESDQSPYHEHLVRRVKSDSKDNSGSGRSGERFKVKEDEILVRPVEKWSSEKNRVRRQTRSFGDEEEEEEEEVDAKADDFINRFKNQLRLQRLDSLKRFGEMLKGRQS